MMRHLPLRSRLALLVAAAVAVAVAACAGASWLIVRQQLAQRLDSALAAPLPRPDGSITAMCPDQIDRGVYFQPMRASGDLCARTTKSIVMASVDLKVMNGSVRQVWRTGQLVDGTKVRVLTRPLQNRENVAVAVARPITEITRPLKSLAVFLALVAGIGVLGAATTGLVVARAALRPVDRLAEAAEHIARTEDLNTPIPVHGKDEIARLSESFNTMTAALAASQERQRRLVADAGHELRTPLTSLRANIDLLLHSEKAQRPLVAEDKRTLLGNLKGQMGELSTLVADLLQLARPGPTRSTPTHVDLRKVVEEAVARARLRGPEHLFHVETHPCTVWADRDGLARAVINVLDNAVKFSPPGSVVDVLLEDGTLTVRDYGVGIPEAELPYVFDRFWRSPSARGTSGSGLGLAIVSQVAREAGGSVAMIPAEGGGTVVTLRLPVEQSAGSWGPPPVTPADGMASAVTPAHGTPVTFVPTDEAAPVATAQQPAVDADPPARTPRSHRRGGARRARRTDRAAG